MPYAKKAAELVQMAVKRVPKENDYIILDRCAGTGNLEAALIGLKDKNGDDLISHCVVSTYEYYEYKVLQERIGGDVREIIPPTEANVVYENGRVANADAMSEDFINNPIIKQYIDNPKCRVILFENPPYSNNTSKHFNDTAKEIGKTGKREKSYVFGEFKKFGLELCSVKNTAANDLTTLFIWSGFQYYLRKNTDSYIVFAPIQYHKTLGLIHHLFEKGYLFNRKYFHSTEGAISCIYWSNEKSTPEQQFSLSRYDIDNAENIIYSGETLINRAHITIAAYNDSRKFNSDTENGITCNSLGQEENKSGVVAKYNTNIIAYISLKGFNIGPVTRYLMRVPYLSEIIKKHGYYLRDDVYITKLPVFCAKHVPLDKWYEKDIYATTADGGDAYTKDKNFLKSCLIYTCLSNQNKCLSFDGSDGRRYQNELCFDNNALALKDLKKYQANKTTSLDDKEKELLKTWDKIISEARETKNYNPEFNYGIYQITKELNTFTVTGSGKNKKRNYDYIDLNSDLITLRTKLKQYYKSHITQKMFKYELLK